MTELYKTTDLYEAAALRSHGHPLESLERKTERIMEFHFAVTEELAKACRDFDNSMLLVEPKRFQMELRGLKSKSFLNPSK